MHFKANNAKYFQFCFRKKSNLQDKETELDLKDLGNSID
jgi:hypothetical protein